jgi:hypothetical protein
MRDRALDAMKFAESGASGNGGDSTMNDDSLINAVDEDEEQDDENIFSVAIRPMTPLDSNCIRTALQNILKKVGSHAVFEPSLRLVEYKLNTGKYASAADCCSDIDAVWQRNVRATRFQKEQYMKEGFVYQTEFRQMLDQACKENGTAELGGIADLCVVRRLGMTRPHTLFSLFPKTDQDLEAEKNQGLLSPQDWETLGESKSSNSASQGAASEDWIDRLYKARLYTDLSREDRLCLLTNLVNIAVGAEEIRVDIRFREAEIEKARSKFGNANQLYSIAGSAQIGIAEAEQTLNDLLAQHQGTLEPSGVPLEVIEHVKRDIHEEFVSRKRHQKTFPLRTELDRLLAGYEVRPKFLGYDRLDRGYFHFPSTPQSLFVFKEEPHLAGGGTGYQINDDFLSLIATLQESRDARDTGLATAISEVLPMLANEPRTALVWCRVAEPEDEVLPKLKKAQARADGNTGGNGALSKRKKEIWLDFGPSVGSRVGRWFPFTDQPDSKQYMVGGFIAAYLPPDGTDPALWKMIHDDGDAEDLEAAELDVGLKIARSPVHTQCGFFFPFFPDTLATRMTSMRYAKSLAERCFSVSTNESKRLLDMKIILLCIEKALAKEWPGGVTERVRFQQMVFRARTWQGLRTSLAFFEWKCVNTDVLRSPQSPFIEQFKAGAAGAVDTPYLLSCRLLALDRALKYMSPQAIAQALKEKQEEERKQAEEARKALQAEKKRKLKEEQARKAEETKKAKVTSKKKQPQRGGRQSASKVVLSSSSEEEEEDEEEEQSGARRSSRLGPQSASVSPSTSNSNSEEEEEDEEEQVDDDAEESEDEEEESQNSKKRVKRGGNSTQAKKQQVQRGASKSRVVEDDEEESESSEDSTSPKKRLPSRAARSKSQFATSHQSSSGDEEEEDEESEEEEEESEEEAKPSTRRASSSSARSASSRTADKKKSVSPRKAMTRLSAADQRAIRAARRN